MEFWTSSDKKYPWSLPSVITSNFPDVDFHAPINRRTSTRNPGTFERNYASLHVKKIYHFSHHFHFNLFSPCAFIPLPRVFYD
jgi:hypothetical protein